MQYGRNYGMFSPALSWVPTHTLSHGIWQGTCGVCCAATSPKNQGKSSKLCWSLVERMYKSYFSKSSDFQYQHALRNVQEQFLNTKLMLEERCACNWKQAVQMMEHFVDCFLKKKKRKENAFVE